MRWSNRRLERTLREARPETSEALVERLEAMVGRYPVRGRLPRVAVACSLTIALAGIAASTGGFVGGTSGDFAARSAERDAIGGDRTHPKSATDTGVQSTTGATQAPLDPDFATDSYGRPPATPDAEASGASEQGATSVIRPSAFARFLASFTTYGVGDTLCHFIGGTYPGGNTQWTATLITPANQTTVGTHANHTYDYIHSGSVDYKACKTDAP